MSRQVEVLLPTALNHGFDYAVPDGMALAPGDLVRVPFGRGESLGVVWGEGKAKIAAGKIKTVKEKLDFPPLGKHMREFLAWAAWYNCAPVGMMLKMVLPVNKASGSRLQAPGKKTLKPETRNLKPTLSPDQRRAADHITQKLAGGFSVTLLDGVTGSGKTEVYFDLIPALVAGSGADEEPDPAIRRGLPQTLILLPEIALSVQWLARFEARFGFRPLVWHSQVTPAQKREAWKQIARGEAPVVVGARSALFLPYRNLRLIVVDEEHDQSYKQEEVVIYHARDMAVARARFEQFPVVLVSATPSLESYHNAKQGKYTEVSLPTRHAEAEMPTIHLLDMRKEKLSRGGFISDTLREKLSCTLASGHQSMLFLNRRGYAPLVLCRHCGHRFECSECSSWLVLHQRFQASGVRRQEEEENVSLKPEARNLKPSLHCHHCNHREPVPKACPACGKEETLAACGPGVERVREEVAAFLPEARLAVMASDQLDGEKDLAAVITAIERREIDIVIGTQMIAKGHHFASLALVGVVDGDLGLSGGDLRAAEKTYQLLHQLSGRAGREKIKGEVYLQSYLPEHPVMQALVSGDREAFLQAELTARQNAHMPPFTRLAAVIVEGAKEDQVIKTAKNLAAAFSGFLASGFWLLGPAPAPLYRLRGKYRYRLLVKAERKVNLPDLVKSWVEAVKPPSSVRVKIDMDPVGFL